MEPLYQTSTIMTYEEYKKFCKVVENKKLRWITTIVLAYFMLMSILSRNYVFFSCLLLCVFSSFLPFFRKYKIKKMFQSDQSLQNQKTDFKFYENYFSVSADNFFGNYEYCSLHKIIETETNFYLFTDKISGSIVKKENCTPQLCEFLHTLGTGALPIVSTEGKASEPYSEPLPVSSDGPLYETTTIVTQKERSKIVSPFSFVLFIISYVIFFLFDATSPEKRDFSVSRVIISLLVLLFALLLSFRFAKVTSRHIAKNSPDQTAPIKISFYDTYFVSEYLSTSSQYQYSQLYKIKETKTNFYLMPSRQRFIIIIKENCSPGLLEFLRKQKKTLRK